MSDNIDSGYDSEERYDRRDASTFDMGSPDRRGHTCDFHAGNSKDLLEIKQQLFNEVVPVVSRQTGQWKVFMWGFLKILIG
jgi:hypothetical protein